MARHRAVQQDAMCQIGISEGPVGGVDRSYRSIAATASGDQEDKIEVLAEDDELEVVGELEGTDNPLAMAEATSDAEGLSTEDQFQSPSAVTTNGVVGGNESFSQSFRRWSSNLGRSVKNNKRTVYNKTIRLMPSRLQKTLSIDGDLITTSGSDVDHITMELEQREQLMEDNPIAEQLRIEAIKSIAQRIATKRQIRAQLTQTVNRRATRSKSIGLLRRYNYSGKVYAARAAKLLKSFVTNFELFYGSMKQIEGHFGSRISAYFKFLRWLLVLDLTLLLFIVSFVTFPQLLAGPMMGAPAGSAPIANARDHFSFVDLFTGEGYLARTVLYYGAYSNQSFTLVPGTAEYSLPHAYFLTITVMVLATFIVVSISMGRSYRFSFIEASGTVQNILTHKIFCSWDYGIANEKAARLKHATIRHELLEQLAQRNRPPPVTSRWQHLRSTALHALAHATVLALIGGVAASVWALLVRFGESEHFAAWSALYVSLLSNVTRLVLGRVFRMLGKVERYRRVATQLNIQLLRDFLLQLTIVGVLVAFWLTRTHTGCWETAIGQELYRLIVVDFLLSTLLLTVVSAVRYGLHRRCTGATITPPPFCLETHSLGLIYNQTLLWFGLLFAPLLVPVVALKFLFLFYVNKFELLYLCQPPTKLWRSSQTQTLLLVLVFVSLFGVLLIHGYIITQVRVSSECGPFRGTDYMYQLFMQGILKLREEHLFWRVFVYITKPAIIGGVLLAMGVVAYYLRAKSRAQIAKVKLLKELLCMEAKDKEFLLANLSKIARGKECIGDGFGSERLDGCLRGGGLRSGATDRYATDPSATWRYEHSQPTERSGTGTVPSGSGLTGSPVRGYYRFEDEEKLRMRRS
ncbi:transmembrane channel-like protein 6 [Anopheles aquasalis]|uniref:transmembrane channel-like protein 6 n=1 Tax=Anopheles aquasalis TaxID=42839 RepID=UPI00215B283E|nr:transmembrane channel-like protein 6 [Anopheles aquasalis]XP_050082772.1 transmembrane channel-like protein 6 [Anopheles aquasalis]